MMKKLLTIAAMLVFLTIPATAQLLTTGVGPRGSVGGFVGPSDVIASPILFFGLRAVSAAYATANGKLANIVRASDSHACDILAATTGGMGLTASCGTGGDNGQSASAFCNATTCKIATLYDQSGALACAGAACNLTQATGANQPALTFSCVGSLPCITFGASSTVVLSRASSPTQAQPFTYSQVYFISTTPDCGGTFCALLVSDSAVNYIGTALDEGGGLNRFALEASATSKACGAVVRNAWHASQGMFSDATSSGYTDGSSTVCGGSPGANGMANTLNMGNDTFSDNLVGNIAEIGVWASAFNGTQQSNMNANQHAYWGF